MNFVVRWIMGIFVIIVDRRACVRLLPERLVPHMDTGVRDLSSDFHRRTDHHCDAAGAEELMVWPHPASGHPLHFHRKWRGPG